MRFSKVCLLPNALCKIFTKPSFRHFEPVRPTAVLCICSVKVSKIYWLPNLLCTISTSLLFERFHRRDRLSLVCFLREILGSLLTPQFTVYNIYKAVLCEFSPARPLAVMRVSSLKFSQVCLAGRKSNVSGLMVQGNNKT